MIFRRNWNEGNNAFCTKYGLLGHIAGVCHKGQPKMINKVDVEPRKSSNVLKDNK